MAIISKISTQTQLGFIGLGYLGSRIASRLAKAGFPMIGYDRDPAKAVQLSTLRATLAQNVRDLAGSADAVLSCLPYGAAVETAYMGASGVLESARRGTTVLELSTISPEDSLSLHQVARQFEVSVLDVAVSGSTQAAESGKLTLFGG